MSGSLSIGAKLNNARAETVAEKPSFRTAFAKHRCLIPANGFYEWQAIYEGGKVRKQPWYIHPPEGEFFAFAGLLSRWKMPEGVDLVTTCVITTSPNSVMEPIHDRMPVILPPEAWVRWLEPGIGDSVALKERLVPASADGMAARPVSMSVNNCGGDNRSRMFCSAKQLEGLVIGHAYQFRFQDFVWHDKLAHDSFRNYSRAVRHVENNCPHH